MSSRFRTPEELERMSQLREHAELLEIVAASSFVVGLVVTIVASVVLLDGTRRHLAVASLICLVIAVIDTVTWDPLASVPMTPVVLLGMLFMTLVSIVRWPVRTRWVNWPLVTGSGIATLLLIAAFTIRPDFI